MTADDLRPLDAAIEEIRLLHAAAERASARIGEQSERIAAGRAGAPELVGEVADALVERTEAIREDCERLTRLLQRARAAVAAGGAGARPRAPLADVRPDYPAPPPAAPPTAPDAFMPPVPGAEPPYAEELPSAPMRLWRRVRRGRSPEPQGPTPPRLPRPDFSGAGVGPATEQRDYGAPAGSPVPEGVRLIATQMAIAGSSRAEVERRLRRQFGIIDATPALDEIFGYGSTTSAE